MIHNANDAQAGRQGAGDSVSLTRSEVVRYLGKHVSWVRRREGSLLHPRMENGVHRFDAGEVEEVERRLAAESAVSAGESALLSDVHAMFVRHSGLGGNVALESVSRSTGIHVEAIRRLYKSCSAERRSSGHAVRPLLTEAKVAEAEQREIDAINREYDRRMAQYEAEDIAWRREVADRHRKDDERRAAEFRASEAERRRRRDQQLVRVRQAQAQRSEPDSNITLLETVAECLSPEMINLLRAIFRVLD